MQEPATNTYYHALGLRSLLPGQRWGPSLALILTWLATLALSIALGLASIIFEWSGLPLHFGGVDIYITLYPPLILCTLWVLWFGFWWGFVPAYLATLVLALYSGMPFGWSLLFAFADPLSLAVIAIAYRAIPIAYDLRSFNSLVFFVLISFVGSIFGATGSFIWTHTNALGMHDLLAIWQGWWLGALLQNLILVVPLLYLFSPALGQWRERHLDKRDTRPREAQGTLLAIFSIILGVLAYLYFTVTFSNSRFYLALADDDVGAWRQAAIDNAEAMSMLFWVILILILFIAFFGAQLFKYWLRSLQSSARELGFANINMRREIAQREEVERDLHTTADRLSAANASKDRLFSIVAHDLRGPVSSIVSLLGILDEQIHKLKNRELSAHFDSLRGAMDQLMRFLENLLQWSHLQLKQDQYQPETIELADAMESACGPSLLHASLKSLTLSQHVAKGIQVYADANMLQTILHNLLTNAIKFTPKQGEVTIRATQEHDTIYISVEDTGVGIDSASLSRLFDISRIESRPGTNGETGNGMGLLLCKELVERHGGKLWVESQAGQGTRIHFTLPSIHPQQEHVDVAN